MENPLNATSVEVIPFEEEEELPPLEENNLPSENQVIEEENKLANENQLISENKVMSMPTENQLMEIPVEMPVVERPEVIVEEEKPEIIEKPEVIVEEEKPEIIENPEVIVEEEKPEEEAEKEEELIPTMENLKMQLKKANNWEQIEKKINEIEKNGEQILENVIVGNKNSEMMHSIENENESKIMDILSQYSNSLQKFSIMKNENETLQIEVKNFEEKLEKIESEIMQIKNENEKLKQQTFSDQELNEKMQQLMKENDILMKLQNIEKNKIHLEKALEEKENIITSLQKSLMICRVIIKKLLGKDYMIQNDINQLGQEYAPNNDNLKLKEMTEAVNNHPEMIKNLIQNIKSIRKQKIKEKISVDF